MYWIFHVCKIRNIIVISEKYISRYFSVMTKVIRLQNWRSTFESVMCVTYTGCDFTWYDWLYSWFRVCVDTAGEVYFSLAFIHKFGFSRVSVLSWVWHLSRLCYIYGLTKCYNFIPNITSKANVLVPIEYFVLEFLRNVCLWVMMHRTSNLKASQVVKN